jgi:hypothetical protein
LVLLALMYGARETTWKGDVIYVAGRRMLRIVQDQTYPSMWRIELPDGRLTDMVNRSRAKDAAMAIAVSIANRKPENRTL